MTEQLNGRPEPTALQNRRQAYRPDRIRVLFVGESPPAGGTFFYHANSNLHRYTQEAFEAGFSRIFDDGWAFLDYFKHLGCYLDDLCLTPINHLDRAAREAQRRAGVAGLHQRIQQADPQAVIAVMRGIAPYVREAAQDRLMYALPFPSLGHQRRYVAELEDVLRTLRNMGVLPM